METSDDKWDDAFRVDPDADLILQAAAEFAAIQGYTEIRSPHLFAALLTDRSETAPFAQNQVRLVRIIRTIHPHRRVQTP